MNGTGLRIVLKSPQGDTIVYSICCIFKATKAEYEALMMGLTAAKKIKIKHMDVTCDSLLIVNQVSET